MEIKAIDAASAYARAMGQALKTDENTSAGRAGGSGFQSSLGDILKDAIETTAKSEAMSTQAVQGNVDVVDLVTAVANAEVVVETVVAVRDRVIQAYNDIIRMPM